MIKFNNIEIRYGDFIAVPELNLEVKEGEFFTLLGPSGCGKTTTLRALAGFIQPSKGNIEIDGKDITNTNLEDRQIGMVFQSYALFPSMTAYENIAFGLKVEKRSKSYIDKRVKEVAKMVDLSDEQLSKNVANMSGGQQQRVAIARALAKKPKILVMDEPLSNLDAKLRKSLRKDIKEFQSKYGITTVYVTHDQEEALMLSDRIAVFNKGVIDQVGTPDEIYNKSETEFVCNFIGEANIFSIDHLKNFNLIEDGDASKNYYVRPEKILFYKEVIDKPSFKAEIIGKEFYGMYGYYILKADECEFISFQKEARADDYLEGMIVNVVIDPKHILSF